MSKLTAGENHMMPKQEIVRRLEDAANAFSLAQEALRPLANWTS